MHYILDSSVIIKWFSHLDEDDVEQASMLLDLLGENMAEISIPDLSIYEVGNALKHNKNFTPEEVKNIIGRLMDMGLDVVEVTKDLISKAIGIAYEEDITVYDAIFISIADHLMTPLVTADDRQYKAAKKGNIIRLNNIRYQGKENT
jgi:predicted nucleic acid-binding protein